MKTFKVYSDPQHGWIAVKRKLLIELGITDKITPFSYQRGQTVYLEEDLDAGTFLKAFKEKYGYEPLQDSRHTNNNSPIRSYEPFKKD